MSELIVIGFGGLGRELYKHSLDCGRKVLGFLDDNAEPGHHGRYEVLGAVGDWINYPDSEFVVAVGSPRIRKLIVEKMDSQGEPKFATLIHPSVVWDQQSISVGPGTVVCAGCVGTVDFSIGSHTIVNIKCTLAHDDVIGNYVTIAPLAAISGNVTLEDGVEVGTGASVRQGVTMGRGSMLGMGGVLTKNAASNEIWVGNPAKMFKQLQDF